MKKNTFYATLLITAAMIVLSCQKNNAPVVPQKDLADSFVGLYIGSYHQTYVDGTGGGGIFKVSTWVNKTSANEVLIHMEDSGNKTLLNINGIVKNDTLLELPIQIVNGENLKNAGKSMLMYRIDDNICDTASLDPKALKLVMKLTMNSVAFSPKQADVIFVGQK
jgi:hypothetical protein